MKPNVTLKCYFGDVMKKPERFGNFSLVGFDTGLPIQVDLQYMANAFFTNIKTVISFMALLSLII